MSQMLAFLIVMFAGITLGLLGVDRLARGIWRKILTVMMCVVLVGSMRLIFLDNDAAWLLYQKNLIAQKDITWRQSNCLLNKIKSWQHFTGKDRRYFALGSSQVNVLIGLPGKIFHRGMSGLSCYEYPFFRGDIASKRPSTVILYLSEFDLTSNHGLKGIQYLPADASYLISFLRRYIAVGKRDWLKRFGQACLAGYTNLVPEVKYAFIPRSFLNKSMVFTNRDVEEEKKRARKRRVPSDDAFLKLIMAGEAKQLTRIPFDENDWWALEEFIDFFEKKGIKVVILEGQYYPAVMSSGLAAKANQVFRNGLQPIIQRHPNVSFIPRGEQFLFKAGDYERNDWVHVKKDAAFRYNEYLLRQLS